MSARGRMEARLEQIRELDRTNGYGQAIVDCMAIIKDEMQRCNEAGVTYNPAMMMRITEQMKRKLDDRTERARNQQRGS